MSYLLGLYEDVVEAARAINEAAGCPIPGRSAATGERTKGGATTSVCLVEPSADGRSAYLRVDPRYEEHAKGRTDALTEVKALPADFYPSGTGPDAAQKRAKQADYLARCAACEAAVRVDGGGGK